MAHFASRPFSDEGFVMSNLKGLTFDMTFMVWPTRCVAFSEWRTPVPNIPSRSGCTDVRLRSLFYSDSRLLAHVPVHHSELVELPGNDPLLGRTPGKAFRTPELQELVVG